MRNRKMKKVKAALILTVTLFTAALTSAEPVGTAFTYQGKLIDAGEPADGFYDLQFALFDDAIAGNQQGGTITKEDIDTIDGFFTVQLDFGSDVFTGDARWLQVAVRPGLSTDPNDFVALSPLQELTAAPYAASAYEVTGRVRTLGIYEATTGYAEIWTAKATSQNWRSIAMSADGSVQTAVYNGGRIYISTDYWDTWTSHESYRNWTSVAMSADGQLQTAVVWEGQIYVSTDYGDTWTAKETSQYWKSVVMSADGAVQTAVVNNGQIYVSTDYGDTWTAKGTSQSWESVAMSADGSVQTAVVWSGQIYVSTDFGNTWTPKQSDRRWWSVAMSEDGQIQTAVVYTGQIYLSTDFGDTWAPKDSDRAWRSVAMSADGSIQTAVVYTGQIYLSTDFGDTWAPKGSNRYWYSVAISADGRVQTALVDDGQIYVSSAVPMIGIGTTNPGENLDVVGTVKASNFNGAPWRSPGWTVTNAGPDDQCYFPPGVAVSGWGFYKHVLTFDITMLGVVISGDPDTNGDSFSMGLYVNGSLAATSTASAIADNSSVVQAFPSPVDVIAGSSITVKCATGNNAAELAVWLYGRTNE
jgi:hypothetical protein